MHLRKYFVLVMEFAEIFRKKWNFSALWAFFYFRLVGAVIWLSYFTGRCSAKYLLVDGLMAVRGGDLLVCCVSGWCSISILF